MFGGSTRASQYTAGGIGSRPGLKFDITTASNPLSTSTPSRPHYTNSFSSILIKANSSSSICETIQEQDSLLVITDSDHPTHHTQPHHNTSSASHFPYKRHRSKSFPKSSPTLSSSSFTTVISRYVHPFASTDRNRPVLARRSVALLLRILIRDIVHFRSLLAAPQCLQHYLTATTVIEAEAIWISKQLPLV